MNDHTQTKYLAIAYAIKRHDGQRRGGRGVPYVLHPLQVAQTLDACQFLRIDVQVAALLHDVVEDTFPATEKGMEDGYLDIETNFGVRVRNLVQWLTLPLACRDDHVAKVRHQIEVMEAMDDDGRAIKIADKMSNVADLLLDPPKWSKKAMRGYADDSLKVVLAALKSSDTRITDMIRTFHELHTTVVTSL